MEAVAISVYLVAIIPLLYGKKNIFASVAACAKYGAGFVLPIGAAVFLLYKNGILADQIFWNITYPSRYISLGVSNQSFISQILVEFVPFVLSTVILWVLSCLWMKNVIADLRNQRKSSPSHFSLFLILWLAASLYATFLGNRMYGHYFIQILPPLSLMAALAAGKYVDEKGESRSRYWRAASLALTVIPGIVFTAMAISYEATTDTWGGMGPDFRPATEYIKTHTGTEDKIFVWGWFTPIYVYSERTPSTRFVNANKHVGYKRGNDPNEKDRADITWLAVPEAWPMLETDLNRDPPELIVDTSPGNYHDFGRYPLRDYPILRRFVDRNCRLERKIGGTDIYRCGGSRAK